LADRSPRRLVLLVACGLLFVVGVAGTVKAVTDGRALPSAVSVHQATQGGSPSRRGSGDERAGPVPAAAERFDAARALLARQARALTERNRAAYLRTVDPHAKDFAARAARTYDNLVRMGVTEYRFGAPVEDTVGLTPDRRAVLGPTAWVAEVDVTYKLEGDPAPWRTTLRMVFVERDGVTYVAADREGQEPTGPTALWWEDEVTVVRGTHSLLIGVAPRSRLERIARTADRSVERVSKIWGQDWAQHVVVLVPATQQQMERVVGVDAETQGAVAAVTTSVERANPTEASHIVLNPDTFDKIGSLGRLVVLTHETTHVAAGATVSAMPLWLSEGFADYVGFHDSGLSTDVIAQEFLAKVRRSGPPRDLPQKEEFDPQAEDLDEAYEAAWTACRFIASRWGEAALVDFYRAMDSASTEREERRAYREVLGITPEDFVEAWRDWVRDVSVGG
jgi:hypothetical protein